MTTADQDQHTAPIRVQRVSLAVEDVTLLRDSLFKGHSWTALTILADAVKQQAPDLVPLSEVDIIGSTRDGIMRLARKMLVSDPATASRRAVDVYRACVSDGIYMDVTVPPDASDDFHRMDAFTYVTQVWVTDDPATEVSRQRRLASKPVDNPQWTSEELQQFADTGTMPIVRNGQGLTVSEFVSALGDRDDTLAQPSAGSASLETVALSVSVEQPADVLGVGEGHPANAGYESVTRERLATDLMLQAMEQGVITFTREAAGEGRVRHVATAIFGTVTPPPSSPPTGMALMQDGAVNLAFVANALRFYANHIEGHPQRGDYFPADLRLAAQMLVAGAPPPSTHVAGILQRIADEISALKLHPATGQEYDAGYIGGRGDAFAIVQEAIDNLPLEPNPDDLGLSAKEQKAQAERCGCHGTDDYCPCQNSPDSATLRLRAAAKAAVDTGGLPIKEERELRAALATTEGLEG